MRIYQKLVGACFDNDELIVNHFDVLATCPLKTATAGDGDE